MARTSEQPGAISRVIAGSARNPLITILLVLGLGVWGWLSLSRAPLDAIPDLSDAQVIIFTEWMGRSPDLVEDQITYPISSSLIAAPGVKYVRGQSMFGMSFIYVIFEDGTDIYWARSRVLEYLNQAQAQLPAGVTPRLGPDATGVGWVFEYALVDRSGRHDAQQLRSLQDWNLRYALTSVKGVAEVASVGGAVKQYQVNVDPQKLLALKVPLRDVMMALQRSNADVGGQVMEIAGHEHVIRGRGYVHSTTDLEEVPLKTTEAGVPVRVKDIGEVGIGQDIRRGLTELNGEGEVPGGIVIMRYGENALDVIDGVKARLAEIRRTLPEGVQVVVTYDRSELIRASIDTLRGGRHHGDRDRVVESRPRPRVGARAGALAARARERGPRGAPGPDRVQRMPRQRVRGAAGRRVRALPCHDDDVAPPRRGRERAELRRLPRLRRRPRTHAMGLHALP
jgi:copper/silver efflux system protein